MERPPLVCCYYTTDAYIIEAARLRDSVDRLKLEAKFTPISNLASWSHAVMFKPEFIQTSLINARGRNVLYVDADAEFKGVPDWSIFNGVDMSWHLFQRTRNHSNENLTGTMFFRNSVDVITFLNAWRMRTRDYAWSSTPEQESLKDEWADRKWKERLIFRDLPPELVFIFDDFKERYPKVEPVILHHQASRRLRHNKA